MGGDEFIIVFFGKNKEKVEATWMDIAREFHRFNLSGEKTYELSASHGIAYYEPGMLTTVEEILEVADRTMYEEKISMRG
ncbi:diguanylate cyclase/phosphodiesterase [Bacillus sp. OxB-1]|nr:diguanylate cyclase/phosphodiesterase [Bacillus sp. OxB-1]